MSRLIGIRAGLAAVLAAALAAALAPGAAAAGGEEREVARQLVERHKDAIVLVEAVVKVKFSQGGQTRDREHRMETNGTVISPEGLTVVSHGGVDPTGAYGRMGMKIDVATSDVKIVLADGTEHEAELVLTDKDLDLAFVRPKAQVKLSCIELKKAADPALLDRLVSITRMGRKASREPGVAVGEVMSVLRKPRVRYMVSGQIFQGCPVFSAAGEVLGLALVQPEGTGLSVLPCEDILEAAKQAAAKKPGEAAPPPDKPEPKPDPGDEDGGKGKALDKAPEKPAADPDEG